MHYDELVREVASRDGFDSREHAEAATQATLSVLAERLTGNEARQLAAQLPGLADLAVRTEGGGEDFGAEEFLRRVARREGRGCGAGAAAHHARAVLATVAAAVSEGEWRDVVSQLPQEFGPYVFGAKHSGAAEPIALDGTERRVVEALARAQSVDSADDAGIAAAAGMPLEDVRPVLDRLVGKDVARRVGDRFEVAARR